MESNCLNCSSQITGKFCANCGQKSNTHRITFFHFITHDLLHGAFHLERGIVFTLKETLVRPGKAALDYISGKRIRYYNVFYLSLILLGLAMVLYQIGSDGASMKGAAPEDEDFLTFMSNNLKMILLGFVPLLAINARILFWKMRLNVAEHFIVAGFTFVGVLIVVDVILAIVAIIPSTDTLFATWLLFAMSILAMLFPVWAYGNLVWKNHSALGFLWRIVLIYALLFVEILSLTILAIWLITGKTDVSIN